MEVSKAEKERLEKAFGDVETGENAVTRHLEASSEEETPEHLGRVEKKPSGVTLPGELEPGFSNELAMRRGDEAGA